MGTGELGRRGGGHLAITGGGRRRSSLSVVVISRLPFASLSTPEASSFKREPPCSGPSAFPLPLPPLIILISARYTMNPTGPSPTPTLLTPEESILSDYAALSSLSRGQLQSLCKTFKLKAGGKVRFLCTSLAVECHPLPTSVSPATRGQTTGRNVERKGTDRVRMFADHRARGSKTEYGPHSATTATWRAIDAHFSRRKLGPPR